MGKLKARDSAFDNHAMTQRYYELGRDAERNRHVKHPLINLVLISLACVGAAVLFGMVRDDSTSTAGEILGAPAIPVSAMPLPVIPPGEDRDFAQFR